MNALELVERARAEGLTLEPAGDRLRVRPRERLTPELRAALTERKAEVLALLSAPSRPEPPVPSPDALLSLPLPRFAEAGHSLAVRVSWWSEPLWFVPTEVDAAALGAEGISRGRIWTACELLDLLAVPGMTRDQARTVARAKLEFGGEVTGVRPRLAPGRSGRPA
jgi:hypothetical protein